MTSEVTRHQTLEQQRAAAAWQAVKDAKGKDFESQARSLPSDLQSSGLGQTMAFLLAKKQGAIYDPVAAWIKHQLKFQQDDLLDWLMNHASTEQYRCATAEAIAFAIWMKRFSESASKEK